MNYSETLGPRCNLMQRSRSPYPPKAWLEVPSAMYPVLNDPDRCRMVEEESRRLCREKLAKVQEFHARVCERIKRLSWKHGVECDNEEQGVEAPCEPPPIVRPVSAATRTVSPESAYLDALPAAHSFRPSASVCHLPRSEASRFRDMTEEERHLAHLRCVRASSAVRGREQARQWREDTARKQKLAEIRKKRREIQRLQDEAALEQQRIDHFKTLENSMIEKENKIYSTEMKRLIAARLMRASSIPNSNVLTTPYDAEHPFGLVQIPFEVRRQLRRLPPLCPCVDEWWETNPDKCECTLRNNWTECAQGLEKLMSISVHGANCF